MTDPLPATGLRWHHAGVACRDVDREQTRCDLLDHGPEGRAVGDPAVASEVR